MTTNKNINAISFLLVTLFFGLISPSLFSAQQKPCTAQEYRQFDFWIGAWEVKDINGKVVGNNKIFPILEGCALSENWTSIAGNPGTSYNFYDHAENKWHQTWIDQTGGALYLDGGLVGSNMVLKGYRPSNDEGNALHQITWTPMPDGRVKQHWQVSSNEGKIWKDVFIGFYNKK